MHDHFISVRSYKANLCQSLVVNFISLACSFQFSVFKSFRHGFATPASWESALGAGPGLCASAGAVGVELCRSPFCRLCGPRCWGPVNGVYDGSVRGSTSHGG